MGINRWTSVAAMCALGAALLPGTASAADTGPPLSVPRADLDQSLQCSNDLDRAQREPVLLVPGTTQNPDEFSWNYVPQLQKEHIPFCTVKLPDHAMSDAQDSAEYVVNALRTMRARSGHKVEVVGHSQGGMVPRWALKFWPDTRGDVDDLIGLAPSNHGTAVADTLCATGCAPSIWQQKSNSTFLTALNAGAETYPGISYTQVASRTDEIVVPNSGESASSFLHTGRGRISNVQTQSVCPLGIADHITSGTSDPVAYAAVQDAIDHPGPADPARFAPSTCASPFMPSVDPVSFPGNVAQIANTAGGQFALHKRSFGEPPLKPYAAGAASPAP
jgi:triacylglycerol esterase/lipase EstA (alpha/beta hydrolase family)